MASKLYLDSAVLMQALGDDGGVDNGILYDQAIDAASRRIDFWTGRHFYQVSEARVYRPTTTYLTWVGDFASTSGLVIKTDDNDDGVFETTWSGSDWAPEPFVRYNTAPYTHIQAIGSRPFLLGQRRATVQVTSPAWGWPAIPAAVAQSCQILSIAYYKSKDFTGGDTGLAGFGTSGVNVRATDTLELARDLIRDYVIRPGTAVLEVPSLSRNK